MSVVSPSVLCLSVICHEHELDELAGYLGHDLTIHRKYYRLPENTVQLAKVTKILMAVNRGIGQFTGKKLKGSKMF